MDSTSTPAPGGIATELASAGFTDAHEVGRGGAGVVYRCYQTSLRRHVAVKVLAADIHEDSRERFLREGYAMGGLSGHPNIAKILQVGVTETNRPYIVMSYYSADSLAVRLRRVGPIPWTDAVRIAVKLCGALETAHRAGTLHRDIKPGNVLVDDYGEPQLTDFGIAHIADGYETVTGLFTGTMAYTAPEVLAGNTPTVAADVYSLGATLYALVAGTPAYERNSGEDLIAQYLRVTSTSVPDLRPHGIPSDVCEAIEQAMSPEPEDRPASASALGRDLQEAQLGNGLTPDSMALSDAGGASSTMNSPQSPPPKRADHTETLGQTQEDSAPMAATPAAGLPDRQIQPALPLREAPPEPSQSPKKRRGRILFVAAAAVAVLLLVAVGIYYLSPTDNGDPAQPARPTAEAQAAWQPVTDARVARAAVAATQADGTIWIFGGVMSDGMVSARQEGYDPSIEAWKSGQDLPVGVRHATAVTWRQTPVVLGGWQSSGGGGLKVATDRVWQVVNGRWVALPPLLQPRAAAAAAVVDDRIVITGGVGADGALLETTEVFDGDSWTLGAELPIPRQRMAATSDGERMYVVGGRNGNSDLSSVEAYDPVTDTWTNLPDLPEARSGLGVTVADGRLLAVGGASAGQVLNTVSALDLTTLTWTGLPDMGTARHGMALATVADTVYAIGGSTGAGDREATPSAEALKLESR